MTVKGHPEVHEYLLTVVEKMCVICQMLDCPILVVHPIVVADRKQEWELNLAMYRRLMPAARKFGVKICLENMFTTQNVHKIARACSSMDDVCRYIDTLNAEAGEPLFGFCYDVGHANFTGSDPTDAIRLLGNRIGCTHIHDNNGVQDQHTLPFWGTICWEAVMKAFAQIGYTGNLSFEAGCFVNNVPEQLRPKSAAYMAEIGRYLIDRFHFFQSN